MQRVRATARQYRPLGSFHIILGPTVRSVPLGELPDPARSTEAGQEPPFLGDERHAQDVTQLLGLGQIWKAIYASGRCGSMSISCPCC